jgi:hypothetical protein
MNQLENSTGYHKTYMDIRYVLRNVLCMCQGDTIIYIRPMHSEYVA